MSPLVYVMGPSGAGKDSLIEAVRDLESEGVIFAVRDVTRAAAPGGRERSLSPEDYEAALAAGRYVLHWRCHGMGYGLDRRELEPLERGRVVVVNGSRELVATAARIVPSLRPVTVLCRPEELERRLRLRAREDPAGQADRLARAGRIFELAGAPAAIVIDNSGPLELAANSFRLALRDMNDFRS